RRARARDRPRRRILSRSHRPLLPARARGRVVDRPRRAAPGAARAPGRAPPARPARRRRPARHRRARRARRGDRRVGCRTHRPNAGVICRAVTWRSRAPAQGHRVRALLVVVPILAACGGGVVTPSRPSASCLTCAETEPLTGRPAVAFATFASLRVVATWSGTCKPEVEWLPLGAYAD